MRGRISGILVVAVAALVSAACSSEDTSGVGGAGGSSQGGTHQGGTHQGGTSQGGTHQGGTSQGGTGQGGTTTGDPHETYHQLCVDKINALRATKSGLNPYSRWTAAEACVDQQATDDEQSGVAHQHFQACGESSQNECEGSGMAGIEGCLDSMWSEKDQPGCSGCDACADAYDPNCPNCDFYGTNTGDVCGHYVNMSAKYLTEAACGFSSLGGWAAIDFH
jgi:hypothetical protein